MKIAALLIFTAASMAQVVNMDESAQPELKVDLWFQDVPGATQYNIYREFNAQGLNTSCPVFPATAQPIASTTDNYYVDDPAPGLWQVPPSGQWRSKIWWCYSFTSIVNGVESAKSNPVAVAVADAFYVNLRYQTACTGDIQVVEPFPYLNGEVSAHFYYTDPSGVDHEFPVETIHNSFGQTAPYNEEWEGKIPVVANDGTTVPWVQNGKYRAVIVTPDGGNYTKTLAPMYNSDASYYAQRLINRVQGGPDCPVQHDVVGGEYEWWQNVVR